jgi:alcohol dehydrogenase YqhD (iron-dependent ADH family)
MLDATLALNGLTQYGKRNGDWGVHGIGHEISLLFDTPHGATLSIVYPAWLKLFKHKIPDRIQDLMLLLFGDVSIDDGIKKIEDFFVSIGSPVRLSDIGLHLLTDQILRQLRKNKVSGMNYTLSERDYVVLLDLML